jgi:oxygen-independent coproporphyrinogen-3 oxidase
MTSFMSFGVYFHIPYCIQRCSYCDFATYEKSQILPPSDYVEVVKKEMRLKRSYFSEKTLDTIYFGGGTPSLLEPELIVSLVSELATLGFVKSKNIELTLEINPATLNQSKLDQYLEAGFNRFSVGAQTFDDDLLKMVRREHTAQQTLDTLSLLRSNNLNFNFDLLFALPKQTWEGFCKDVEIALQSGAQHLSPYCLTIPTGHVLSKNRPVDDVQVQMFEHLMRRLPPAGYQQYEISNFAIPGSESKHNQLYWDDQNYWGLGLSSHSYTKNLSWGMRFWNKSNINDYVEQIRNFNDSSFAELSSDEIQGLEKEQYELLALHQSVTDYLHTAFRKMSGFSLAQFELKFGAHLTQDLLGRINRLEKQTLIKSISHQVWALTEKGLVLSNQVFLELTFLKSDFATPSHS